MNDDLFLLNFRSVDQFSFLIYFDINQQGWSHYNHHYGSWGVYYDGAGDFYLEYSAVPEPSTYIMVTSLLMVPGYNFVRRYRKKKSAEENEIPENLS